MKFQKGIIKVYESFGILNLFCPYRPNGSYLLHFELFEEKIVLKMLLDLCKGEGWANMTDIKVNGKSMEKIDGDFAANIPEKGTFEGTYVCKPEKIKEDLRKKLGVKYLIWVA